jgi:mannosyltransferase OCH1-like enzyme
MASDLISIPKIVHLTWKTNNVPAHWKPAIEGWKAHNPDWELKLWTDADNREYIRTTHPYFLKTYDSYPYSIQRADAIRYFLLRDFGGVYSDLDIQPTGSINSFLEGVTADALLVYSGNVDVLTNSFMASPKGSPFWDKVIKEMLNPSPLPWYAVTKHFIVMHSTGPVMLDRVYRRYRRPVCLLPRRVFMAYSIDDHGMVIPGAVLRPLQGGSWNGWDSILINFLFRAVRNPTKVVFVLAIAVAAVYIVKGGQLKSKLKVLRTENG